MDKTRRKILLSGCSISIFGGLSGCSSPNTGAETPTETPEELYALTGSYSIPAGEFRDLELDITDPAVIAYTVDVISGSNIDILALTRGEFREYERDNEFEIVSNASALDTSYGDVRADLGPQDINVVFDNTEKSVARPKSSDEVAEIDFELTVTRRDPS